MCFSHSIALTLRDFKYSPGSQLLIDGRMYVCGNALILSNFRLSLDINSLFLRIKVKCFQAEKFPGDTCAVLFESSPFISSVKQLGPLSRSLCHLTPSLLSRLIIILLPDIYCSALKTQTYWQFLYCFSIVCFCSQNFSLLICLLTSNLLHCIPPLNLPG